MWHFQTFATTIIRRDFRDRNEDGSTEILRQKFGMSRLETKKLSRDFRDQGGDSAAQETVGPNSSIPRLSRPRWRRRNFCDQRGNDPDPKRLSRLKLSARLCNLCLNRDEVRPTKSGHES